MRIMLRAVTVAIAFAVFATGWTAGALDGGDRNASPYAARREAISGVRKIKVVGAIRVFVMAGPVEPSTVTLAGPPELLADARTKVEDGVLTIAFREGAKWSWNPGSGLEVAVSLPALEGIETDGPAQVEVVNVAVSVPDFAAVVNGAGKITVTDIKAQNVNVAVGGSGLVQIGGTAEAVTLSLGGAGTIDAKRLRAATGAISVGGPGAVFADISGAAQINVGGPGRVEVVGGATCTTRAPRQSQVECR